MTTALVSQIRTELLLPTHDTSNFVCGVEPALQSFLRDKALRLQQNHTCAVYLLVDAQNRILGYFTLSPASLHRQALSKTQARKYDFDSISAMLLGQFARDSGISPKGFGATMLREALAQAVLTRGWQVLCVDPFSNASEKWFLQLGFRQTAQHYPARSSDVPRKHLKLYMTRQDVEVTLDALAGI